MPSAQNHAKVEQTKPALINYVAAIFAATGSFLFGYDSGIIGSVISESFTQFQIYFNNPAAPITGAIVSVFAGGAFFGAILAGWTADKIGRKRTIQLGATIAVIGCTLQTAAVNISMLIVGRLIAGFSVGVLSMIVPMYQAEISPPHVRGLMSGMTQWMISWGFFVANWVGYGSGFLNSPAQFRVPLGVQIIPAALLLVGMFVLPFSPRWLVAQGRHEEARQTLFRLHGGRHNTREDLVEAEYQEIFAQVEWDRENLSSSFFDLFKTKPNFHRAFCGCAVQAMCQWTGVNVNAYFGPTIYTALGFTGHTTLLINGISGAWGLVVTFIFIAFIVDRIGRRWPLIIGSVGCMICMALELGTSEPFTHAGYANKSMGIAGVWSVFMFSWFFSWSYGPVSWIYQSEIFPMNLRAVGTAASTATNWANNVIIGQITPLGFKHLSYRFFAVFVCTNAVNLIFCVLYFPETKHKSLEEIGLLFGDTNVRVYVTGNASTSNQALGMPADEKDKHDMEHHETHRFEA